MHVVKPKPQLKTTSGATVADALLGTRKVFFEHDGELDAAVYDGTRLEPGMTLSGPAIVQDMSSSLVLPPLHGFSVDSYGNFIIDLHFDTPQEAL
jgi:N-methylhydantoinase A